MTCKFVFASNITAKWSEWYKVVVDTVIGIVVKNRLVLSPQTFVTILEYARDFVLKNLYLSFNLLLNFELFNL